MTNDIKDSEDVEPQVEVNVDEIMDNISLKLDDEPEPEKPKKEKKQNKVKVEVVDHGLKNPTEEDEELTKELYGEFSSFLENKADIREDTGVKVTISTGIDLVDAILGGGFAVGALNIIVGQPVNLGTGAVELVMKRTKKTNKEKK